MKICILLTDDYPFGKWETFLETESLFLQKRFDHVYVVPFCHQVGKQRDVPSNFSVVPIKHKTKLAILLSALFKSQPKDSRNKKIGYRILCKYLYEKAYYFANCIFKFFFSSDYKIHDGDEIIIYSYWLNVLPIASIILKNLFLKRKIHRVQLISRAHRIDVFEEDNKYNLLPYQPMIVEQIDKIFPCSNLAKQYLSSKYPLFKEKINVARLGSLNNKKVIRNHFNKVFVTCSRLNSVKRLDLFAEAFCLFLKKCKDAKWLCIGTGDEKAKITKILNSYNAEKNVEFLGYLNQQEISDFYSNHEIGFFVNVSKIEGVPVSIMEALSFSIPVIATDVGATNEIVSNKNGFLLESDISIENLADVLLFASNIDEDTFRFMSNEARMAWEEKCNAEVIYTKWVETF